MYGFYVPLDTNPLDFLKFYYYYGIYLVGEIFYLDDGLFYNSDFDGFFYII